MAVMETIRRTPNTIVRELHLLYIIINFAVIKIMHWVLFWFPSHKAKIVEQAEKRTGMHKTTLTVEQWQDSIVSFQSYLSLCRSVMLDSRKLARQGGPAINSGVVTLDSQPSNLLDYQNGVRPLVVVFGSCT